MTETETPSDQTEQLQQVPPKKHFSHFMGVGVLCAVATGIILYSTSLNAPSKTPEAALEIAAMQRRIENIEARLASLAERSEAPQASGADQAFMDEALKRVESRMAHLEVSGAPSREIVQKMIAAAFAFRDVREAAREGRPFPASLTSVRAAAPDDAALGDIAAKIEPFAAAPPPSWEGLGEALAEEEKNMPASAGQDSSFWGRVKQLFRPLISVQPLHRFKDIKTALALQDGAAVLAALQNLSEEEKQSLAPWRGKLEARLALDAAVQELSSHLFAQGYAS